LLHHASWTCDKHSTAEHIADRRDASPEADLVMPQVNETLINAFSVLPVTRAHMTRPRSELSVR
jgi:hypothetical protein